MNMLRSVISPLVGGGGALPDTLKLVVIGGTVETARRVSASAWTGFVESFFLTAHFSQDDYPYDWLMHWLSKQPAWSRSREFDITTRSVGRLAGASSSSGDLDDEDADPDAEDGEGGEGESSGGAGKKKRRVAFMPSMDTTHTIYYRGHWLRITRTKRFQDYGHCAELKISVVARNNDILKKLVLEAKRMYEKDAEHRVHIFLADPAYGCWRYNGSRQKRPMSSIVLEPGVKEMLLADCKDFMASEDWYAERGIPFRRGYLLHGVPGSGKTSLIHSLAGELGLDIYVVSLSAKGMSDNTLTNLMGHVPSRCILLLEDLDAAFTRSVSRDTASTGAPPGSSSSTPATTEAKPADDGSTLSLSGLLNSLDGVAAAEGRLLFATTNHIERLDPALSRPGRMDVWVNFGHATKWQAEGIFKCFFPHAPAPAAAADAAPAPPASSATVTEPPVPGTSNLPISTRKLKSSTHAIPRLSEAEVCALAARFGAAIPEDEFSVASLQGYLLRNKTRPREAVEEVGKWVISERETRAKLLKEKEEREKKEKKEREEKEKKEKEEKEKTDKETKEKEAKEAKEEKEKEKAEKKESKKHKKRADAAAAAAAPVASDSDSSSSASSASSSATTSEDESSSAGVDADTESATSEEESVPADKAGAKEKEKWVAVKGQAVPAAADVDAAAASAAASA